MEEEKTIYIVEDDEPVRDSLVALLESEGFAVVPYGSAEDFLAHFHPDGSACLLLDLELPGKNGLELLEILGARPHHVPVIVITGKADLGARAQALDLGAAAVFIKPANPDVVIATIREAAC